jgi:hypothetical protein
MAAKTHGYLSILAYSTADVTYTDLTDAKMVGMMDQDKGDVPTTVLDSPNHTEEFLPGWRKPGEIRLEVYFHKTQFNTLLGFFASETIYWWRLSLPLIGTETVSSKLKAQGYVKKIALSDVQAGEDDTYMVPITIKVTGPFTFTAGT